MKDSICVATGLKNKYLGAKQIMHTKSEPETNSCYTLLFSSPECIFNKYGIESILKMRNEKMRNIISNPEFKRIEKNTSFNL